jgi:hypothetical protein
MTKRQAWTWTPPLRSRRAVTSWSPPWTIRPGATVAINAIHLDRVPGFSYDLLWRAQPQ